MKRTVILILGAISLVVASVLAKPFVSPFVFPNLLGQYSVGSSYFHWIDDNRLETHAENKNTRRELMVRAWYPIQGVPKDSSKMAYAPSLVKYAKERSWLYTFSGVDRLKSHAYSSLPDGGIKVAPVLIYSHGLAGVGYEGNTALCEQLASSGFVVFAINHTFSSLISEFPDGRRALNKINTERKSYRERQKIAEDEIEIWLEDIRFVVHKIEELVAKKAEFSFMDTKKLGVFGHSFGGASAVKFCKQDMRCLVGANLDGALFANEPDKELKRPFLFMLGDESIKRFMTPSEFEEDMLKRYESREEERESMQKYLPAIDDLLEKMDGLGEKVVVQGADHGSFSDGPLLSKVSLLLSLDKGNSGSADPFLLHDTVSRKLIKFFRKHLE